MRDGFNGVAAPAGGDGARHWRVRLQRAAMIWIDLAATGYPTFNTRQAVTDFLEDLHALAAQQGDKRFIYFIASRKRLRFSARQPGDAASGELVLWTEEGRERTCRKFTLALRDVQGDPAVPPRVCTDSTDDRFITLTDAGGHRSTWAIHDLFQRARIGLSEGTHIHYIGRSDTLWTCPVIAPHAGLIDLLSLLADGDRDFFLVCNLLTVTSASGPGNGLRFGVPCPTGSAIDGETESALLEKALLFYFQPQAQLRNHSQEVRTVRDALRRIAAENHIASLTMHYEMDEPHDYFTFYSSRVPAQLRHAFRLDLAHGEPRLLRNIEIDPRFPDWG